MRSDAVFLALAAVFFVWIAAVFGWLFLRRRPPLALAWLVILLALTSVVIDLHGVWHWLRASRSPVTIEAMDRGSWWELSYRDGATHFVTANELHVPAGELVKINGQLMLFDRACVVGRTLRVIPERDFAQWFRNEASPARASSFLFTNAGCAWCHVIRGVAEEPSNVAPDLTHVGARRTIACTDLPMREAELMGWIVNSRALKKSSRMPLNRLEPRDLFAMVRYLESLR